MTSIARRALLAGGATLAMASGARKSRADEALSDVATALQPYDPPKPAPPIAFVAADGREHRLAEFAGRAMVVNLWATWCAPCVAEMPSLAMLSKALAPSDIAVLPLSSDRAGASAVATFYRDHGITGLPVLLDPHGAAGEALNVRGIPTSFLIDRRGMLRARLEGAADWSRAADRVRKLLT